MAKIRYLLDIHVPRAIADGLRRRGVEVITAQNAGFDRVSDLNIFRFAFSNGWIVVTSDSDFTNIAADEMIEHGGLVYLASKKSIGSIIEALMLLAEIYELEEMFNNIEYL